MLVEFGGIVRRDDGVDLEEGQTRRLCWNTTAWKSNARRCTLERRPWIYWLYGQGSLTKRGLQKHLVIGPSDTKRSQTPPGCRMQQGSATLEQPFKVVHSRQRPLATPSHFPRSDNAVSGSRAARLDSRLISASKDGARITCAVVIYTMYVVAFLSP